VVQRVTAQHAPGTLVLVLSDVEDFPVRESRRVPDTRLESVAQKAF
jgi:hypothetical protein